MKVRISNKKDICVDKAKVRKLIRRVVKEEGIKGKGLEISILLTDDKGIRELNKRYLRKDNPTDVLSFRMWEGRFTKYSHDMLGDIVVNVERAKEYKEDFEKELALYIVHGLLHLLGYIDDTKGNAKIMQTRCEEILTKVL